jgi:hypothetical protein
MGLTAEQVKQIVNNTVIVLLVRSDMVDEWQGSLSDLLQQVRRANLDDEAVFVAAVLTLLNNPDDTLPTGTTYDRAWESILVGLQTGVVQEEPGDDTDNLSLDRLLNSVAQATIAIMTRAPDQKPAIMAELRQIRVSAEESDLGELQVWLDDVLALLDGGDPSVLGAAHQGIYQAYWAALVQNLGRDD